VSICYSFLFRGKQFKLGGISRTLQGVPGRVTVNWVVQGGVFDMKDVMRIEGLPRSRARIRTILEEEKVERQHAAGEDNCIDCSPCSPDEYTFQDSYRPQATDGCLFGNTCPADLREISGLQMRRSVHFQVMVF
jgi:hypothetical protein